MEPYQTDRVFRGLPVWRKEVDFGALPNATEKIVPHGLNDIVGVWASAPELIAQNPQQELIGTNGAVPNGVDVTADGMDVRVATLTDLSRFDDCTVILEYVQ